jgi:hypothetical protein
MIDRLPFFGWYPCYDVASRTVNHRVATTALREAAMPVGQCLGVIVEVVRFPPAIRTSQHWDEQDDSSGDDGKHKP